VLSLASFDICSYLKAIKGLIRHIFLGLFVFLGFEASSQLYFGVKGAYSIPFNSPQEIKYDDFQDFLIYRVNFIERDATPTLSILGYYRSDWIYFQLEAGYKRVKTRFIADNYFDLENITKTENTKTTHSLDFPIIAGLRLEQFKLGFGPTFSFILKENPIFQDIEFFEERRNRLETGFAFHFGVVLYRFHIDLSYHYRFNGVGDYLYWRQAYRGFSQPVQYLDLGFALVF